MTISEEVNRIIATLDPSELCEYIEQQQITINRQEVKIARLEEEKESYRKSWVTAVGSIKRQDAEIERLHSFETYRHCRAKAVKECIETIKSRSGKVVMTNNGIIVAGSAVYSISEVKLYEIEKEMAGAESGC